MRNKKVIEFEVEGKIIPKQSTRFCRNGFAYTSHRVTDYAQEIKNAFAEKYSNFEPYHKAISVSIMIYMAIPKGFNKLKTAKALKNEMRPTVRPDCDNCAKQICDSLNGLAYIDDKQIVELSIKKFYAEIPCVYVSIEEN